MKAASVSQIKKELKHKSQDELIDLVVKMSNFKKESKEKLTYMLFEADDEQNFINELNAEVTAMMQEVNTHSFWLMKKTVRKVLRHAKKHIRYSKKKETEAEILIHFCREMINLEPSIKNSLMLSNIFYKQKEMAEKAVRTLHEDLQYDYNRELEDLVLKW